MDDQGIIQYNKKCNFTFKVENDDLKKEIVTALKKNKFAQQILKKISNHSSFKKQISLLLFNRLIYILDILHQKLVSQQHSAIMSEHQRVKKTLKRLTRTYYFPYMQKKVKEEVQKCNIC